MEKKQKTRKSVSMKRRILRDRTLNGDRNSIRVIQRGRVKRVAERNEKIAKKLRDDASEDKSKGGEQAKAEKEEVRTSASLKKKRITEDTKEERADNSTEC